MSSVVVTHWNFWIPAFAGITKSGIYPPSKGRITYFGKDISKYPIYRRAALGIARTYQVTNLFRCLTVAENILMACQALERTKFVMFRTLSSYQCHTDRCDGVLKEFDLWGKRGELVKNLSHGDQRRIEALGGPGGEASLPGGLNKEGFKGINANSKEDNFQYVIPAKAGIQV